MKERLIHSRPDAGREGNFAFLVRELAGENILPIVVASHPRSGTHLLIDTLRLNFEPCSGWKWWGERLDRLYLDVDHVNGGRPLMSATAVARVLRRPQRPLVKTHAWPGYDRVLLQDTIGRSPAGFFDWLEHSAQHLYVYRDGREVMRSLHHLMQDFDADARVPLGQFIRQKVDGVSRARAWADHVRQWARRDDTHCVKMEELLEMPALTVGNLADHLGLKTTGSIVLPNLNRTRVNRPVQRMFSSHPPCTAIVAKTTRPLQWQQQLTRDDMKFFRDETEKLLVTLTYEQWSDWPDRY